MSCTQLFILNKELKVEDKPEWENSWLFPPVILNHLINKYAPEADKKEAVQNAERYGLTVNPDRPLNFLTYFDFGANGNRWNVINNTINNSTVLFDRIGWELINQQMFRSIDKDIVAEAIFQLQKDCDGDEERFAEIADTIKNIDFEQCPYFILKNTTCDDGVEKYFERYNEDTDEIEDVSLAECEGCLDFKLVAIANGVMNFQDVRSIFPDGGRHEN